MSTSILFRKTREDLAKIAIEFQLLEPLVAESMTRQQLIKFLSDAQKNQTTSTEVSTPDTPIEATSVDSASESAVTELKTKSKSRGKAVDKSVTKKSVEAEAVLKTTETIATNVDVQETATTKKDSGKKVEPKKSATKKTGKMETDSIKSEPVVAEVKEVEITPIPKNSEKKSVIKKKAKTEEVAVAVEEKKEEIVPEKKEERIKVRVKDKKRWTDFEEIHPEGNTPLATESEDVQVPVDSVNADNMDNTSKHEDSKKSKHHFKGKRTHRNESTEETPDNDKASESEGEAPVEEPEIYETGEGILEIMSDGYGFLRRENYIQGSKDIFVPTQYIRKFNLRNGDKVSAMLKKQKPTEKYPGVFFIKEVNGQSPDKMIKRPHFDRLTPIYPNERLVLETTRNELSTRIIDLVAPIGKGQRGVIVSPPKAGKTILLQKIANAITKNNPDIKLIVLLIDERPEEVTDMQRSINGEVVYSTFDKTPENHVKIVELVLARAMRLVELGEDVVILLDSLTRLGRAYNLQITPTGRTLSGGLDPGALYGPKKFFGAARNIENGGSLTIIATSLIETGSRMDEVIFEEFKGTGNMEVILDRKLSEKRIFPAIDITKSGTRREELLLNPQELDAVWTIRKAFSQMDTAGVTETIINTLLKTTNNKQFVSSVNITMSDKNQFDAMRGNQRPNGSNGNGGNNSGNY